MAASRSMRERSIMAFLGVTVLYAILLVLWTNSAQEAWKKSRANYENAKKTLERENRLIAKTDWWKKQLARESSKMPRFPEGKDVDTWLWPRIDSIAAGCNLLVHDRITGNEEPKGNVFERALETHNAESSLKSLVRFMCALETSPGAMFDIRDITINPNQKTGYLKTTFKLGCAYMRGDAEEDEEEGVEPGEDEAVEEEEEETSGETGPEAEEEEEAGEAVAAPPPVQPAAAPPAAVESQAPAVAPGNSGKPRSRRRLSPYAKRKEQ